MPWRAVKKNGSLKLPSSLYIIETAVVPAQFDAMVGKVKIFLPVLKASAFAVSSAFPPLCQK